MTRIFDSQNSFFQPLSLLADCLILSALWLLLSLPLVTLGAASAALYASVRLSFREESRDAIRYFFRRLREDFRPGILPGLVSVAVISLFFVLRNGLVAAISGSSSALLPLYYAWHFFFLLPLAVICWLFPLLARFEFKPAALFTTALRMSFKHFPTSLYLLLTLIVTALACDRLIYQIWPVFIFPALLQYLWSWPLERVFAQYAAASSGDNHGLTGQ